MQIRFPSLSDRTALEKLLADPQGNPFRAEEVACALELLAAVLDPPPDNTYQAVVGVDEHDVPRCYACFGKTPMTEATYDLYWMVTEAAMRGQGLGAHLLAALEGILASAGALTLRIETSSLEGNGGARRFYERCGYTVAGIINDFYRQGDDLITLVKRL